MINAIRAHLAEFGIVAPVGRNGVEQLLGVVADPTDKRVPEVARACLAALGAQLRMLKAQILEFDRMITVWHRSNETSKRLDEIPGVGPALATALVASVVDPKAFRSGRDFSAWIGLVPKQHSSGGRDKLGSISKQGDRLQAAAHASGMQLQILSPSTSREIDMAFEALVRERADALFVGPDAFFNTRRVQLANMAARHAVPTAFAVREYVDAGGLMSYGTSLADMYREVGVYTGRILKGVKPADLPVVQSSKFELVINLQTAKMLGIDVPPSMLARADEVIE